MPTYEYACKDCGEHIEVVQSFRDEPLTVCPACGGPLRKVFGSVGITFKGSGFYKTDSRGSSKSSRTTGESKSGDSKTTTTESKGTESKGAGSGGDSGGASGGTSGSSKASSEAKTA